MFSPFLSVQQWLYGFYINHTFPFQHIDAPSFHSIKKAYHHFIVYNQALSFVIMTHGTNVVFSIQKAPSIPFVPAQVAKLKSMEWLD
jgi:hypothetical protein